MLTDSLQRGDRAKSMFVAAPVSDEWEDEQSTGAAVPEEKKSAAGESADAAAPVGRLISSPATRPKQPAFAPTAAPAARSGHVIAAQPPSASTMQALANLWDEPPAATPAAASKVAVSASLASIFDDEPAAATAAPEPKAAAREADLLFGEPPSAAPKPVIDFFAF